MMRHPCLMISGVWPFCYIRKGTQGLRGRVWPVRGNWGQGHTETLVSAKRRHSPVQSFLWHSWVVLNSMVLCTPTFPPVPFVERTTLSRCRPQPIICQVKSHKCFEWWIQVFKICLGTITLLLGCTHRVLLAFKTRNIATPSSSADHLQANTATKLPDNWFAPETGDTADSIISSNGPVYIVHFSSSSWERCKFSESDAATGND